MIDLNSLLTPSGSPAADMQTAGGMAQRCGSWMYYIYPQCWSLPKDSWMQLPIVTSVQNLSPTGVPVVPSSGASADTTISNIIDQNVASIGSGINTAVNQPSAWDSFTGWLNGLNPFGGSGDSSGSSFVTPLLLGIVAIGAVSMLTTPGPRRYGR